MYDSKITRLFLGTIYTKPIYQSPAKDLLVFIFIFLQGKNY